jgi:hypothetical protein
MLTTHVFDNLVRVEGQAKFGVIECDGVQWVVGSSALCVRSDTVGARTVAKSLGSEEEKSGLVGWTSSESFTQQVFGNPVVIQVIESKPSFTL